MEVTCTDRASFLHLPCYHPHLLLQCTCIHLQSAWSPALWPALIAPAVNILTFSCNPQCNTNLQCSTNLQICPPAIHFHLHWLHVWPPVETHANSYKFRPPSGATCIGCKFGHRVAPLGGLPNWHHQLVSSSARVTSFKSANHAQTSEYRTNRFDPRYTQVYPGRMKKVQKVDKRVGDERWWWLM